MLTAIMVETAHDEERLARIEQMIEALQRESGTMKTVTAKIIDVVQVSLKRDSIRPRRRTDARPLRRLKVVDD
jgi:hypothetical protein